MPKLQSAFLLVLTAALSLSAPLRAQAKHGDSWMLIIKKVEDRGITQVGDFNIAAFRERAENIQWLPLSGAPPSVASGSRGSAFYLWNQDIVYISDDLPAEALASLPQLELHEALGATGHNDADYALSTALNALAQGQDPAKLTKIFGKSLFRKDAMSDGGTSVSGGGDLATLFVKDQVLKVLQSQASSVEILRSYPSVNFEPVTAKTLTQVRLKYQYLIRTNSRGEHEVFSIFVPMRQWKKGGATRTALIREIARQLTEIFPAYGKNGVRRFTPEGCTAGQQVSFPQTQDSSVATIQSVRGSVQLGCHKFLPGERDYAVEAPALAREEEPRTAGNYYFDCMFRYGSAHQPYQLQAIAGRNNQMSGTWGLSQEDVMFGFAVANERGVLTRLALIYHPPGDKTKLTAVADSKDGSSGIVTLPVNGKNITFECKKSH